MGQFGLDLCENSTENDIKNRTLILHRCHMFYADRVVDVLDDLPKWAGMPGESESMESGDT
jgi:hypothetical protein